MAQKTFNLYAKLIDQTKQYGIRIPFTTYLSDRGVTVYLLMCDKYRCHKNS